MGLFLIFHGKAGKHYTNVFSHDLLDWCYTDSKKCTEWRHYYTFSSGHYIVDLRTL